MFDSEPPPHTALNSASFPAAARSSAFLATVSLPQLVNMKYRSVTPIANTADEAAPGDMLHPWFFKAHFCRIIYVTSCHLNVQDDLHG